jgi:hypothetical protein
MWDHEIFYADKSSGGEQLLIGHSYEKILTGMVFESRNSYLVLWRQLMNRWMLTDEVRYSKILLTFLQVFIFGLFDEAFKYGHYATFPGSVGTTNAEPLCVEFGNFVQCHIPSRSVYNTLIKLLN